MRTAAVLALLAAACAAAARRGLIVTTVDGSSMEPALRSGDRVLVRRARRARRGQVALLRFPPLPSGAPTGDQMLLKRVVAVAGDRVPEHWADPDVHGIGGALVPREHAVVLGDNRPTSWDSRHYGFVPREQLVGVVVRPLFPAPGRVSTSGWSARRSN